MVFASAYFVFLLHVFVCPLDFEQGLFVNVITFPQFFPSLVGFAHEIAWGSTGFVVVLLLTIVFGRAYCSFLCPLGILQDVFSKIVFFKKKRLFVYRVGWKKTSYVVLALAFVSFVIGPFVFVSFLDPFSNFGKVAYAVVRPLWIFLSNAQAYVFNYFGFYDFHLQAYGFFNAHLFGFGICLGFLILVMVWKRGRLFCNSLCPIGAFLGFFSKHSLLKIHVEPDACSGCNQCESVCKAECLDSQTQHIDYDRCVLCFNCITACEQSGVQFGLCSKALLNAQPNPGRRDFVTRGLAVIPLGVFGFAHGSTTQKRVAAIPPGAESHSHFHTHCTTCQLCVTACPTKVLQPSWNQHGPMGLFQPFMDFNTGYCNYGCTLCSKICPTNAIKELDEEEKRHIQIGSAHFIERTCVVVTDSKNCGACSEHCPTKAVQMVPYKCGLVIPRVESSICVGCGACEYACPTSPKSIYVQGHSIHQKAQIPSGGDQEKVETLKDFPF